MKLSGSFFFFLVLFFIYFLICNILWMEEVARDTRHSLVLRCLFVLNIRAQLKYKTTKPRSKRQIPNFHDSVVALIWCQMLTPVCFMGHCFQIHPLSLQQPPLYNMFRPSARKRLLTASKFPAFLNHIDGGLDCHLFFYFHRLIYVARQSQKLGADAVQTRCVCVCATSVLINLSPRKWNAQQ